MTHEWVPEMGEISGFGGSYEAGCRAMVAAGMKWFDEHADADPHFKGFKGVYGLIVDDNDDAKALTKAMMDAELTIDGVPTTVGKYGATGAMHQAAVGHVLAYKRLGWEAYKQQLVDREKEEVKP